MAECAVKTWFCIHNALRREDGAGQVVAATTRGRARYQYLLDVQEWNQDAKITDIRVTREDGGEPKGFRRCVERRGIPFATIGMRVIVSGKGGHIVGHNDSSNLSVELDHSSHRWNCHPWSDITYFDDAGNVIRAYDLNGEVTTSAPAPPSVVSGERGETDGEGGRE